MNGPKKTFKISEMQDVSGICVTTETVHQSSSTIVEELSNETDPVEQLNRVKFFFELGCRKKFESCRIFLEYEHFLIMMVAFVGGSVNQICICISENFWMAFLERHISEKLFKLYLWAFLIKSNIFLNETFWFKLISFLFGIKFHFYYVIFVDSHFQIQIIQTDRGDMVIVPWDDPEPSIEVKNDEPTKVSL